MPNIWAIDEPTDKQLHGDDSNSSVSGGKTDPAAAFFGSDNEDELERPSFLRRLRGRKKDDKKDVRESGNDSGHSGTKPEAK
jgi:hypothetical protein